MNIEKFDGERWKNYFTLNVHVQIGVMLEVVDEKVNISFVGAPSLQVIDMINNTGLPFSERLLNGFLDIVSYFAFPALSEKIMEIDVPDIDQAMIEALLGGGEESDFTIEGKVETTTQFIEANNGKHLSFGMGLNLVN
ncbi:MAG: hypothetical protein HRU20_31640 [Pseudomonadales bacterium]|nr:hypothetical protein [Pseudomonadales bacterium]